MLSFIPQSGGPHVSKAMQTKTTNNTLRESLERKVRTTAFLSESKNFKGIKKQASLVSEVLGCLGKYEYTF